MEILKLEVEEPKLSHKSITQTMIHQKTSSTATLKQRDEAELNHLSSSISKNFGNYHVVGPLGRGAAVKTIDKSNKDYQTISKRLQNEIEIHQNLNHDYIVKLVNTFQDQDNHYIMMEYCEGGDLFHYLKSKGRLAEEEAKKLSYQLAEGLFYLHERKIIHRDLKLGNILLTSDQTLKICDFGLAVQLETFEQQQDTLCGTPNYISPEIINREPYGIKVDYWSFGCILYALVTGHPPFEGRSVQQTLQKVKDKSLLDIPKYISSDLADLLKNIFNWEPEQRFSINEILQHQFYHQYFVNSQIYKDQENLNKIERMPMPEKQTLSQQTNQISNYEISMREQQQQLLQIQRELHYQQNTVQIHQSQEKDRDKQQKDSITPEVKQNNYYVRQTNDHPFANQTNSSNNIATVGQMGSINNRSQDQLNHFQTNSLNFTHKSPEPYSSPNPVKNGRENNKKDPETAHSQSNDIKNSNPRLMQSPATQCFSSPGVSQIQYNTNSVPNSAASSSSLQAHNRNNIFFDQMISDFTKRDDSRSLSKDKSKLTNVNVSSNSLLGGVAPSFPSSKSSVNVGGGQIGLQNHIGGLKENQIILNTTGNSSFHTNNSSHNASVQSNNLQQTYNNSMQLQYSVLNQQNIDPNNGFDQQRGNLKSASFVHDLNENSSEKPRTNLKSGSFVQEFIDQQNYSNKTPNGAVPKHASVKSMASAQTLLLQHNINQYTNDFSKKANLKIKPDMISIQQEMLNKESIHIEPGGVGNNYENIVIATKTQPQNPHLQTLSDVRSLLKQNELQNSQEQIENQLYTDVDRASSRDSDRGQSQTSHFKTEPNEHVALSGAHQNNGVSSSGQAALNMTPRLQDFYLEVPSLTTGDQNQIDTSMKNQRPLNTNQSFSSFLNDIECDNKLSPLKVEPNKPTQFMTKNGMIEINKNSELTIEACQGKIHFQVSPDGLNVQIDKLVENPTQQIYALQQLPIQYHGLYNYAKSICQILQSKIPQIKIDNDQGQFTIMENQQIQGYFKNGYRVVEKLGSNLLKIKTFAGIVFEIDLNQEPKNISTEVQTVIEVFQKHKLILLQKFLQMQSN